MMSDWYQPLLSKKYFRKFFPSFSWILTYKYWRKQTSFWQFGFPFLKMGMCTLHTLLKFCLLLSYKIYTGWVKKKCDLRRLVQNCTFFVQLSFMVLFQYFLKICNFFGTPMTQKKIRESFFLSKWKVQKSKIVHSYYSSLNLKFY